MSVLVARDGERKHEEFVGGENERADAGEKRNIIEDYCYYSFFSLFFLFSVKLDEP